jgi:hypothetical protein
MTMNDFVWADAWVLLSLIYAQKPANRKRIVATGDYLNHAVMNSDELEGGLQRLQARGYIFEGNSGFDLGPQGLQVREAIEQAAGTSGASSVSAALVVVETMLGVKSPWDE